MARKQYISVLNSALPVHAISVALCQNEAKLSKRLDSLIERVTEFCYPFKFIEAKKMFMHYNFIQAF